MTDTEALEREVRSSCEQAGATVPWYWSDWFSHAAEVLAVLYDQRGRESGDSVAVWLSRVTAEGDMVRQIENVLSRKPPA